MAPGTGYKEGLVYAPIRSPQLPMGRRMVVDSRHPRHPEDMPHHPAGEVSIAEGDGMAGKTWTNPKTGKVEKMRPGIKVFLGDRRVAAAIQRGALVVMSKVDDAPDKGEVDTDALTTLPLNKTQLESVEGIGVYTVTDLAGWLKTSGKQLKELPGIGEGVQEAVLLELETRGLIPPRDPPASSGT